ncbi:MAG TPA: hypothetical protein VLQ88_05000 [Chromatiaceae bacterium]|nr:hypothetical protein [Chromatiaceae bacterium]
MDLKRIYDVNKPEDTQPSLYEFKHELALEDLQGAFTVKATGLDKGGAPVAGAQQVFALEMRAP